MGDIICPPLLAELGRLSSTVFRPSKRSRLRGPVAIEPSTPSALRGFQLDVQDLDALAGPQALGIVDDGNVGAQADVFAGVERGKFLGDATHQIPYASALLGLDRPGSPYANATDVAHVVSQCWAHGAPERSPGVENLRKTGLLGRKAWRVGRDSNPRKACTFAGFQDRSNQPLCHLPVPVPLAAPASAVQPRRTQRYGSSTTEPVVSRPSSARCASAASASG